MVRGTSPYPLQNFPNPPKIFPNPQTSTEFVYDPLKTCRYPCSCKGGGRGGGGFLVEYHLLHKFIYLRQININPRFDGAVHLILPATNPTSSNRETCDETPVGTPTNLQKSTKVTHLPPVVLYVKYHCGYPSRRPPDFHVSARWLEPGLTAFVTTKLVQYFVPEYPVVFDWISYLLDELVGEYSTQQLENISSMVPKPTKSSGPSASTQGTSTQLQSDSHSSESSTSKCLSLEAAGRELEDSNDRFLSPSSASDRHPCQIFLRSSSQIDDMEEFDRYEAHKEFLQSKHECGICFMEWPGEQFSEPCHSCKQIFCKQCILEYCQVCIRTCTGCVYAFQPYSYKSPSMNSLGQAFPPDILAELKSGWKALT